MECPLPSLYPHFPSLSLTLSLLPAPAASGAQPAPTAPLQAACTDPSFCLEHPSSRNWPGFFLALLKSQPYSERLSLQHFLLGGFVFISHTDHHLVCSFLTAFVLQGSLRSGETVFPQCLEQCLVHPLPRRMLGKKRNEATSGHNLYCGTWDSHAEAVKCKLRTNGW